MTKIQTTSPLTEHQQQIFDNIIDNIETKLSNFLRSGKPEDRMLSLTGSAGTGKTFLTAKIAKYLLDRQKSLSYPEELNYHFVITAPTHKAVSVLSDLMFDQGLQVSCKTIHSFLAIKPFIDYKTGEERFTVDKAVKNKEVTSVLIVDESSMIGSELYNYIREAIIEGNVSLVLFIGDPNQLLPVNDNASKVYALKQNYHLKEVVRQAKENPIIRLATELREAIEKQEFGDLLNIFEKYRDNEETIAFVHNRDDFIEDFYGREKWYREDKILATYKNKDVDAFNRAIRAKYWEEKDVLNPPTLLPGDQLRFKEAYSIGDVTLYHNNQVITLEKAEKLYHDVLGIDYWECRDVYAPKQQIFRIVDPDSMKTFNDKLDFIAKKARSSDYPANKKLWKTFFEVRNMYAQVQYVHASTIHKLQGSTYETVYVDLFSLVNNSYMSTDDKYRLTYVVLTRASEKVILFIPAFGTKYRIDGGGMQEVDTVEHFANIDEMIGNMGW